jgi:hypothetical protein
MIETRYYYSLFISPPCTVMNIPLLLKWLGVCKVLNIFLDEFLLFLMEVKLLFLDLRSLLRITWLLRLDLRALEGE